MTSDTDISGIDKLTANMIKEHLSGKWNVGEIKSVEFFADKFIPVQYIDCKSPYLQEALSDIDDEQIMALNFQSIQSYLWIQICSSQGCLFINHNQTNESLKAFLSTHEFVSLGMGRKMGDLKQFYGDDLQVKLNEIKEYPIKTLLKERLQSHKPVIEKKHDMKMFQLYDEITPFAIITFCNQTVIVHDYIPKFMAYLGSQNSSHAKALAKKQNDKPKKAPAKQQNDKPKNEPKAEIVDVTSEEKISGDLLHESFKSLGGNWPDGVTKEVEFFQDQFTKVTFLYSSNPNLSNFLKSIDDGKPIAMDLEWNPSIHKRVDVFQLCSSRGCLVIQNKDNSKILKEFLETHSFVMKDISCDFPMLRKTYGDSFECDINDIAVTVLRRYNFGESFDGMVSIFTDKKPCAKFKDKKISMSKWDKQVSVRMILYAAYDVVALIECIPNFARAEEIKQSLKDVEKWGGVRHVFKMMGYCHFWR